ncbi:Diguanylate cyclase/phosphodiesterase with PAS/PAC sensor(S) [Candidatus Accumulibacter aalborgensis]|uniref:Diguanylate cyclase/phosphodiesterase with PAS/PAC sensor(S) n=2 Tax=Candidatus Accumulibacter aalborgensis TaxID=1860102 RepID=A0A1A8XW84_9PROT|nr:Diguanylate cyclase/phosphodiesterase with PAS/PAC sensor(S) [Candidatus Accumulibacter aalborgensis]
MPIHMTAPGSPEQQLREYKAILDHSGIAVVCTRRRRVYRCNPRAEELFGWAAGTLVGQPDLVFYPNNEACEALRREARSRLSVDQSVNLETRLARRDGGTFVAHLVARAIDPDAPGLGTVWIVRDITQEVSAREANARLLREQQLVFENAKTGIVILRDRVIQRCNRRFAEILGYAPEELIGKSNRIYYPSDEAWLETGRRAYAMIAKTGSYDGDTVFHRRDGTAIWGRITGSMINPANPDEGYIWLYEDVTEKRLAATAMDALLREQTLIFERAPIGIAFVRQRIIQRCNASFERIFGYLPGQLIGQSTRVCFASEEAWSDKGERARLLIDECGKFLGEVEYRKADGSLLWCRVTGSLANPENPEEGHVWLFEDVTARRAAEEALRQSHVELEQRVVERTQELSQQLHFLRQLIEAIPGPVFYKDRDGHYLGCNQAFLDFTGKKRGDIIGATVYDFGPRDLADRYKAADDALFQRSGSQVYEAKVRDAEGGYRDVVFHKATYGEPGEPGGGLIGVMLDITERRKMEVRLQQAATVFDSSAEGITITSPDGNIIAVNRAFTEITGYREDEVIGRNPRILQSGRQQPSLYVAMWQALRSRGRWQGELWNRRKDGQEFVESLTISAVSDADGRVTHYVGVFSDTTELRRAHDQLDHQAHHDPLTGLPNRLLLTDRLHKALQRAHRDRTGLAVLFIDLDRFKNINDTLGHQAGDRVLCEVALRLERLMRESDTVGRLGGDEFLIVIEDIVDPTVASMIADKILTVLQASPVTVEHEFFVGASIGISVFPQDGEDGDTLMKNADVAMYRAKERGRNTYEFFTKDLTQSSLERLQMETDLRRAIEREELRVYLQPQFSLSTGKVVGAEALLRWQRPEQGLVPPGDFIKLAEESGLIVPIGEWVQRTAGGQWAAWVAAGLNPGVLSVNVSGVEFARGRIEETVRKTLETSQLSAQFLELEITESAIMSHAESSLQVLDNLRAMGIRLVIDDFGTGYSSLAYLKRLPLNKLKVDQSFVRGLPSDTEDCAISRAVIALAHSLQLTVIAEGVETEAQRDFLIREGCDEMQGYLLSKPIPFAEYERRFLGG